MWNLRQIYIQTLGEYKWETYNLDSMQKQKQDETNINLQQRQVSNTKIAYRTQVPVHGCFYQFHTKNMNQYYFHYQIGLSPKSK